MVTGRQIPWEQSFRAVKLFTLSSAEAESGGAIPPLPHTHLHGVILNSISPGIILLLLFTLLRKKYS
jgi:hypothetical protein